MGYACEYVDSGQVNHLAEFTCAICCNLVDAPLLTTCHHVFCTACLQDWFDQSKKEARSAARCPTCSEALDPRNGAGELRLASPLAWRVLGRLRMKCPLLGPLGAPCGWRGEYSELTAHMTAAGSHQAAGLASESADTPGNKERRLAAAEALKTAGNQKFEQRIYADAIALYSKAIELAPEVPTFLLNRAAAHISAGQYAECIQDCSAALALEPANHKAHKRLAKALGEQGDFDRAVAQLREGERAGCGAQLQAELETYLELQGWMHEASAALRNGECGIARTFYANMLQRTSAPPVRLGLVQAELGLGLCDQALRTTRELIKANPHGEGAIRAYVLRAQALLFSSDLEQSAKHLREALRLDPDAAEAGRALKKVRKLERHVEAAKKASFAREFSAAVHEYTAALEAAEAPQHAPLAATMYAERAAARLRLHEYEGALKDCAVALYAQDDCVSAWLTRASALHGLGRHEEALKDMQQIEPTFTHDTRVRAAVQRASFEVRKQRRPDYY